MKQCSHCSAVLGSEDIRSAKCSRCGTLLPFDSDSDCPSSGAKRAMGDVLEQLPPSVRHMLGEKGSYPPHDRTDSSDPQGLHRISGYPDGGVIIRTIEPAPPPGRKTPSTMPPPRKGRGNGRSDTEPPSSVDLLVHLPPPTIEGPDDDPYQSELPEGFDPDQLRVLESNSSPAALQAAEALRRSLQAPPLPPRRRRIHVARLVIGVLILLLLAMLLVLGRLYLNGDLG